MVHKKRVVNLGKVTTFFSSKMRHVLRAFIIHKFYIAFFYHIVIFLSHIYFKNIVTQKLMDYIIWILWMNNFYFNIFCAQIACIFIWYFLMYVLSEIQSLSQLAFLIVLKGGYNSCLQVRKLRLRQANWFSLEVE